MIGVGHGAHSEGIWFPEKKQILLVEDEDSVCVMLAEILKEAGYQVIPASNGRLAYEIFRENRDRIDLILTDVFMPEMAGGELVRRSRLLDPKIPVLFLTGVINHGITADKELATNAAFLVKPCSSAAILGEIAKLLGTRVLEI